MAPTLTPLAAYQRLFVEDTSFDKDGFIYSMDAPAMCDDPSAFFPVAYEIRTGKSYAPAGDIGEALDSNTAWIGG